jgi:hypothetical protein
MVTGNELLKCTHLAGLAPLNQFPVSQLHDEPAC